MCFCLSLSTSRRTGLPRLTEVVEIPSSSADGVLSTITSAYVAFVFKAKQLENGEKYPDDAVRPGLHDDFVDLQRLNGRNYAVRGKEPSF